MNGPMTSDIDKVSHSTTLPIMSSRTMPTQDPYNYNARHPQDQSMFPYYGIAPPMNPQAAPIIRTSAPASVTVQTPDGGIVQLTPEQLKAAAAVAPIPGISTDSRKSTTTEKTAESAGKQSDDAASTSSAISGAKNNNKVDQVKKKFPKQQQPKRPLSPWRTKRASPPNFMRDKDRTESPASDRASPPVGVDRRRAESEGKRKRSSSPADVLSSKDPKVSVAKTFPSVRGRSSSPPKKNQNIRVPPIAEKGDVPKYGSNVAPKKQKLTDGEEFPSSGSPKEDMNKEGPRKEGQSNVVRNPVTSRTKIMAARNNKIRTDPPGKQGYGPNFPPKNNKNGLETANQIHKKLVSAYIL